MCLIAGKRRFSRHCLNFAALVFFYRPRRQPFFGSWGIFTYLLIVRHVFHPKIKPIFNK